MEPVDLTADTSPEGATPGEAAGPLALTDVASAPGERDWGEGPSGEAALPPEPVPAPSPAREAPATAGAAEDGTGATAPRRSLMDDGRRAERLLAPAVLPEFQDELRQLGASAFFRQIASSLLRTVNLFASAKEIIYDEEAMIQNARKEAESANKRVEAESQRLSAALSQLARAEDNALAKELHAAELASALRDAEEKARDAEERAKAADSRVAELEARAAGADARVAEAVAKVAGAEAKTAETAARAAGAEARLAEAEAKLARTEARLVEVEAEAAEAGAKAVADFRASPSFEDELAEAAAEAFLDGFRSGKEKVARDCNFPPALEVEPSDDSDEEHSAAIP